MKKGMIGVLLASVLAVGLCLSGGVAAVPTVFTEPVPAAVVECGFYLDSGAKVTTAPVVVSGVKTCEGVVAGVSSGSHAVKFTIAAAADPIWGSQESAQSAVPFTFSRPAPLPPPVVSGLKP